MRKLRFATNEFYHIYNRGNNKRLIFNEFFDLDRFLQSLEYFNTEEPVGGLYLMSFNKNISQKGNSKLVDYICYCLNPNHFHLIIKQLVDQGVTKIMHRIGTGYTRFFNDKYNSSGSLFQGRFKAKHIDSNEYLLHLSTYINLNTEAHLLRGSASQLSNSSWDEYVGGSKDKKNYNLCNKDIILSQFKNLSEYKKFAEESLKTIRDRKEMLKILEEDGFMTT